MNIFFLIAAVFVIFIAVDILTAKIFKVKRTAIRNISFVSLCIFAVASGVSGGILMAENADTVARNLYNAYSYLIEGNVELASHNAKKADSPHSDMILLLADCLQNNYASAFISSDDLITSGKLNDELTAQAGKVYDLSRRMTGIEGSTLTDDEAHSELLNIVEDCFALLKISEKKEVEFISGFKRDHMLNSDNYYEVDPMTLSEMLLETPDDKELLRYSVKYYNNRSDFDLAEENAAKLLEKNKTVDNIVLYTDIIAQKFLNNIDITSYDANDKEIKVLMDKAAAAENTASIYEEGNPRREENLAKAAEYQKQANAVKIKRIINWLTAQSPLFGDNSGVIDFQLSKLYAACGEEQKASELLFELINRKDNISDDSPIKTALENLNSVYYNASATDDEISGAIDTALKADVFLPDSVLSRGYSQFLNNMLKYERVSVFISRVNADNYPIVRTYLNVNGIKDGSENLANDFTVDDFTFADNGFAVSNKKVTRVTDDTNNLISIALVIDGSGSMDGKRIANARDAVEACINNMDPETQELAIVMYEDSAQVLTPLTNDVSKLRSGAEKISANGGTNIPVGLYAGIESLKDSEGTKAIILMTDGEDGNPEEMPAAIEAAKRENIAVFTVSTGGGEREYMENIAASTGGTFMEAMSDTELVQVYTALQNYIVNNYCFEYTVEEDLDSNPRTVTIGLSDYNVNSSRTYSYGGLVLTKDGSYITPSGSEALSLFYAEPSSVSTKDTEIGIPIFISAYGVTEGTKLFINGEEVQDAKIVENTAITFILKGSYNPGALNISVKLPNGNSKSTNTLLSVSSNGTNQQTMGQTIVLGSNNTIYADTVEQTDDYTLKLSGNVILNNFVRTSYPVTVQSNSAISKSARRLVIKSGWISGSGAAYVDIASVAVPDNYGQIAYGGNSIKVLDNFSFDFDEFSINLSYSGVTLQLPGFGEIYADAQFDGNEFTYYCTYSGYSLSELQNNLNYVINGIPLPQNQISSAMQTITGYTPQYYQSYTYNSNGISAYTDDLTITIGKGYANIVGTGTASGYFGASEISDCRITIDTTNIDSMYEMSGTVRFNNMNEVLNIKNDVPFSVKAKGWYPDTLTLNTTGFEIDAAGLSDCFSEATPPKPLDAAITVEYPLSLSEEPYKGQILDIISDISIVCDKIEFICSDDRNNSGIKAYNSADPKCFVIFTNNGLKVSIDELNELSVFGTDMGGEITGTATITNWEIELDINVDGHLDNSFYHIKHDGSANLYVQLYRSSYAGSSYTIYLTYGGQTFAYNAAATGNIIPQDGFDTYAEDYRR